MEEARDTVKGILKGLKGFNHFKTTKSKEVEQLGYVLIHPDTGHKQFWYGHEEWLKTKERFTKEFWEEYKLFHKGKGTSIEEMVSNHFKEASKYHRAALNSVTQGGGAITTKLASTKLFNWIVDNDYFKTIKIVNITHDKQSCCV